MENTPTFPRAWNGLPAASAFQLLDLQPFAQQGAEFLLPSPSPPKSKPDPREIPAH